MDLVLTEKINDKDYTFKFGFGFARRLDEIAGVNQQGFHMGMAVQQLLPSILAGSIAPVSTMLYVANQTEKNKISQSKIDDWMESLTAKELDKLVDDVMDKIRASNATAKMVKNMEEAVTEAQKPAK